MAPKAGESRPGRESTGRRSGARGFRLLISALTALVIPFAFSSLGSAADPTVEATFNSSGFSWTPSSVSVSTGGTVAFKNGSASVPHGVRWTGGPEKPGCTGVPVEAEKTSWSGTCTFAQAGTYSFVCTVHPTEMKGTIAVSSTGEPPPPPGEGLPTGPVATDLRLAGRQAGNRVHGSIQMLRGGSGSSLAIELRAAKHLLFGGGQKGTVAVGRLVRSSPATGTLTFTISLKRSARRALRDLGKLSLRVTVKASAPGADPLKLTRTVVMHAQRRNGYAGL
jgi:plastocyanin